MNNTSTTILKAPAGASIERHGHGDTSTEMRRETASTAAASQAQAEIQSMYVVARANPRDWDDVRTRLLRECARTAFAAKAIFALERGRVRDSAGAWVPHYVEGLTVRFAESVIRAAGNVRQSTSTLYDDSEQRIIRVRVIDLETNGEYSRDVVIAKTIERKDTRDRTVLAQRVNSYGQAVFLVTCTEDELVEKEGRAISKIFRTMALRFVPSDIIEDCSDAIRATRSAETTTDPERVRKSVADSFASIGCPPSELKTYLGHDLGACSPAELERLRGLFAAIRGGEVTWQEALAERIAEADVAAREPAKSVAEKLAARAEHHAATRSAAPAASATAGTTDARAARPSMADEPIVTATTTVESSAAQSVRARLAACTSIATLTTIVRVVGQVTREKKISAAESKSLYDAATAREQALRSEADAEPPAHVHTTDMRQPGDD